MLPSLEVTPLGFSHVLGGAEVHSFFCFTTTFLHLTFIVAHKESLQTFFLIASPRNVNTFHLLYKRLYICALQIKMSKVLFSPVRINFHLLGDAVLPH